MRSLRTPCEGAPSTRERPESDSKHDAFSTLVAASVSHAAPCVRYPGGESRWVAPHRRRPVVVLTGADVPGTGVRIDLTVITPWGCVTVAADYNDRVGVLQPWLNGAWHIDGRPAFSGGPDLARRAELQAKRLKGCLDEHRVKYGFIASAAVLDGPGTLALTKPHKALSIAAARAAHDAVVVHLREADFGPEHVTALCEALGVVDPPSAPRLRGIGFDPALCGPAPTATTPARRIVIDTPVLEFLPTPAKPASAPTAAVPAQNRCSGRRCNGLSHQSAGTSSGPGSSAPRKVSTQPQPPAPRHVPGAAAPACPLAHWRPWPPSRRPWCWSLTSTATACRLLGRSRASHYRRCKPHPLSRGQGSPSFRRIRAPSGHMRPRTRRLRRPA